jgi:hypothetical protein
VAFSKLVAYLGGALIIGLLAVGCGGVFPPPCGGADYGASNPAYSGAYSGTFTADDSGAGNNLAFSIGLDNDGHVSGTVTEVATGKTAPVTGTVIDWYNPCSADKTYVDMNFSFSEGGARSCDGSRNRAVSLSTPMGASYTVSASPPSSTLLARGTLVLTKQTP